MSQSLNQKLSEIISVKDYGAVTDGATDNAAAFTAIANAVNAVTDHIPTVFFPDGVYHYHSGLSFTRAVTLRGTRGAILDYGGSGYAVKMGPDGLSAADWEPYAVQGLTFTGGTGMVQGIFFNTFVVNTVVKDTWFAGFGHTAAYNIFYNCSNWQNWVHNVLMGDLGDPHVYNGIKVKGSYGTGWGCRVNIATVNAGVITAVNMNAPAEGGSGYVVGDVLSLEGGSGGKVTVATAPAGVVTGVSLTAGGTDYSTGGVGTSDYGQSQTVVTDCLLHAGGTIGVWLNAWHSKIINSALADFNTAAIHLDSWANNSVLDTVYVEQAANHTYCIRYGDITGARTGNFLQAVTVEKSYFNCHWRGGDHAFPIGPSTAGTGIDGWRITNNTVWGLPTGDPLVVMNNVSQPRSYAAGNRSSNGIGAIRNINHASSDHILHTLGSLIDAWQGFDATLEGVYDMTYAHPTMTPDPSRALTHRVNVTTNDAFEFLAPLSNVPARTLRLIVQNGSGGVLGAMTFGASYKVVSAPLKPGIGKALVITFVCDDDEWIELSRSEEVTL